MARKRKGIRRLPSGKWQTYAKIHGRFYSTTHDASTPVEDLRDAVEQLYVEHRGEQAPAGHTLAADIEAYLRRVHAMPIIKQRTAHLALWLQALGRDRSRRSITTAEIDVVLQGWLSSGLAPGTVRKRRTALRSFFSKMDPAKINPVKGSTNPKDPKAEAREINYLALEAAIAAMPERSVKRGATPQASLSKIRARVIAYTGIPPGLLKTIQAHDLSLTYRTVRVGVGRRKGDGVEARTLELNAEGLAAFTAFDAANAYGPFATEALNRSFKRGCKKVGIDPRTVHMYDARHSFLSQVYRVTRDLATVGRLGLHAEGSKATARYAKGANAEVNRAAQTAFSEALARIRRDSSKP